MAKIARITPRNRSVMA